MHTVVLWLPTGSRSHGTTSRPARVVESDESVPVSGSPGQTGPSLSSEDTGPTGSLSLSPAPRGPLIMIIMMIDDGRRGRPRQSAVEGQCETVRLCTRVPGYGMQM